MPARPTREHLASRHHPGHTHAIYRLDCADFDELRDAADGKCQLCRLPCDRLQIDHDHSVPHGIGVRGLVCAKCNSHMRFIDSGERVPDERTIAYQASAWHLTVGRERTEQRARNCAATAHLVERRVKAGRLGGYWRHAVRRRQ